MSNKCMCCKAVLKSNKCSYCGYESDAAFVDAFTDEESASREWNKVSRYCDAILSKLSNFSITAYEYKWNADRASFDCEGISLFDENLNGNDLSKEIVWSKQGIGQFGIGEEQTIDINYSANGKDVTTSVKITPEQANDFWKIGLRIDDNLKLHLYLGETDSGPISLKFN